MTTKDITSILDSELYVKQISELTSNGGIIGAFIQIIFIIVTFGIITNFLLRKNQDKHYRDMFENYLEDIPSLRTDISLMHFKLKHMQDFLLEDKIKKEQDIKILNDYIEESVKELIKYENEHNEKYQALQEHLFDNIIDISNILIQYINMNKYDEDLVEMVKNKLSRQIMKQNLESFVKYTKDDMFEEQFYNLMEFLGIEVEY